MLTSRRASPWLLLIALLLGAGPAVALDPEKSFHHYVLNTWSIEEGLPQISALAIAQDQQGYLWVGTQAGLARFDGVRFTAYTPDNAPGLPGLWIHDLLVDPGNRLWVSTYRGLAVHENSSFRAIPLAGADPDQLTETGQLAWTARGELFVTSPQGVLRVQDEQLVLAYPLPRPATALLASGDTLWVGNRGQVVRLAGKAMALMPLPAGDEDTVVTELLEAQGRLWAGTSAGLFYREGNAWKRHEGGAPLSRAPIESMFEDSDGNLWIGMVENLARLRNGRVRELVINEPAAAAVRKVFEDREGNLWLGGQWHGLSRLWNGWTRRYGTREGLADQMLWSVARGPDGRLWAGSNSGLSVMEGGSFREVVAADQLPHPNVYTLLPEDNTVWIGTRRGLAVLRGDRLEQPPEFSPMRGTQINGILRDYRGALWFATNQGAYRYARGELRAFTVEQGLRDPRTRILYETSEGRLLLGTQAGLYEIVGDRVTPLGLDTGLSADLDVTAIHQLADGELVIGTLSEEIFLSHKDQWIRFGVEQGMPVNSPFFITHDRQGYLWVAGIRGIQRIRLREMLAVASGETDRVQGEMLLNERGDRRGGQKGDCCNGAGNAKGFLFGDELYLPTRAGLVVMSSEGIVKNELAPRTLIERVRVGDQWRVANPSASWRLGQDDRDLSFEFTVLSFQDPKSVELRYRLVGYDEQWRDLDDVTRRNANYTNLPPGSYVFEAIGANTAGVWSKLPAQLGFHIQPRFHETGLFQLLVAAVLLSLVYAGYRRQLGAHQRQRASLEALVSQRTEALEVANLRLEEASQTDPMTGLRNRRYLANQIPADIAYYDREAVRRAAPGEVMVFALVDVDHFKAVNDRYGHAAGDRVLQQFAQVLGHLVRTGDYIARWGGEEFLIVFRPMPNRHLPILGDRILSAVSEHRFDVGDDEPISLSCSIGFIECPLFRDARGSLGWEQMVELADRALYRVKAQGRNGWAAFRPLSNADLPGLLAALQNGEQDLLASGKFELLGSEGITNP
ncbi:two-component regulator propeller domain-containing protein [Arenimonas alkanexedens]